MPSKEHFYGEIATEAAKAIWQVTGSLLTQISILLAADKLGKVSDWPKGGSTRQKPSSDSARHWMARLNPLTVNIPFSSIFLSPFKSIGNFISWFAAEAIADEYQETLGKPWRKLAPVGEGFLKPLVEATITPVLDYLANKGLLQTPQAIEEAIYEACPQFTEKATETLKQAALPEETSDTGLLNYLWHKLNQPLFSISSQTAKAVRDNLPSKMEQVFTQPAQEVIQPLKPVVQEAHKAIQQIPGGNIERISQYAEKLGHFMAQTCSSTLEMANKTIHQPAQVVHALKDTAGAITEAADVIADAFGIHRHWVIGGGICTLGLAGYGLYSAARGLWSNNATATARADAKADATATGGQANGNTLNLQINLPNATAKPNP